MTTLYILIIMIFHTDGGFDREVHPINAPTCQVSADGQITENSDCGIRYCLKKGRERSAEIWGQFPGVGFGLVCKKADGQEEITEGAEPSPGHSGMNWRGDNPKEP